MDDGTRPARAAGPSRVPAPLVLAALVVALAALALTWWLVPWTPAPDGPVDPTAGLGAEAVQRAEQVSARLRAPSVLSLVTGLLVLALLVLSPPGRRGLAAVRRLPGGVLVTVPAQVLLLVVAVTAARWPFGVWAEVVRRQEGLSVRGWGSFTRDRLVAAGMDAAVLVVAVLAVVLLARWLPRWWPVVAAGAGAVLVVAGSLLYPVLVEPAFATHAPLPDGPVREGVLELAERSGAPLRDVLVADTSARSTTLNAHVSGLGPTRRMVLQDTLLQAMPDDQVLAVVAHETAHAASDDVLRGTAVGALGTGALVLGLGVVATARWGRRVGTASAAGVVALLVLVGQVVATPVESLVSRQLERHADAVAVTLTDDPAAFARAQQTLLLTNLVDPSPPGWVQWWFGSHPTGAERVAAVQHG